MANDGNLTAPSTSEARERGQKGGKASGKARREKKQLKDALITLLDMPLSGNEITEIETLEGFKDLKGKNVTVREAIAVAQVQRAMKGDRGATEFIRDTIGEKPTEKMEISKPLDESAREMEEYFEQQKKGNT